MRQTSSLFQTQLLPVSGMSQQARRGAKRKLQLKRGGGRQEGRGHSSLLRMTSLPFCCLSLGLPPAFASKHTHNSHTVRSHSALRYTVNPYCSDATSVPYLTDKTCTSHSYPERKKTGGSNLSSFPLCVIWQCSLTEPLPIHLSFSSTGLSDVPGLFGMRHT